MEGRYVICCVLCAENELEKCGNCGLETAWCEVETMIIRPLSWTEGLMFEMRCVDEVLGLALDVLRGDTPIVGFIVD